MVTITDKAGTNGSVTADVNDVSAALRNWYVDAPADVIEATEKLQAALIAGEPTDDLAAYLGVQIES